MKENQKEEIKEEVIVEEVFVEENFEGDTAKNSKKMKNLISLVILLAGLFVGSIFVDVLQMARGNAIFGKNSQADIFQSSGKTWVAYPDPIIKVRVISDDTCDACKPDEAVTWLHRIMPTALIQNVDMKSTEGKGIVKDFSVKTIPAFIFSTDVEKTDFFQKASQVLTKKNDQYSLNTAEIGLPAGKYLDLPAVADTDIKIGNPDAKVKIIEYSDFQCPYCKAFHPSIQKAIQEYGDKILYVYKQFPLSFHPQANNASLASECANEQGKFLTYANMVFDQQANWGKTTGTQSFKTYAVKLGLNASQFNQCLDSKKYQDKVSNNLKEGQNFGVSGTPATFINSQFESGAVDYATMKGIIDKELAK
jgi:protein-disulfide isomerase